MENRNGGQLGSASGSNVWGQAAAKNAANADAAGLSSAQKQQQTVAAMARQKVLEVYRSQQAQQAPVSTSAQAQNNAVSQERRNIAGGAAMLQNNYREPTQASPAPQIRREDWRRYHSAWQSYYQKYYGEYYGKAAKDYVAKEKLKMERDAAEREEKNRKERDAMVALASDDEKSQESQSAFKAKIQKKVAKRAKKMRKSRHFVPILIGLIILVAGLLFEYNQVIVANVVAYMSPGNTEVNDITAIDPTVSANIHDAPTLMIPKINVEVPVTFGSANDVQSMMTAMSNGVAHFTVRGANANPGEVGNFVVSGHSAGNVYSVSDYKFIFSGLTRMGEGDLIYMDYNSQRYTYRVTGTKVVDPSDVNSLRQITNSNAGKPMITLITCTPLGTSKYRLLVYGEQIHPSYEAVEVEEPIDDGGEEEEQTMPRNDDSPFTQFWKWLTGQQ